MMEELQITQVIFTPSAPRWLWTRRLLRQQQEIDEHLNGMAFSNCAPLQNIMLLAG